MFGCQSAGKNDSPDPAGIAEILAERPWKAQHEGNGAHVQGDGGGFALCVFSPFLFRLFMCNHLKLAWPGLRRLWLGLKCPTSHDYPARGKMMLTQYITHKCLL